MPAAFSSFSVPVKSAPTPVVVTLSLPAPAPAATMPTPVNVILSAPTSAALFTVKASEPVVPFRVDPEPDTEVRLLTFNFVVSDAPIVNALFSPTRFKFL